MRKKHLNRSIIPSSATDLKHNKQQIVINPGIMHDWQQEGNHAFIQLSIRFLQHDHECFSDWRKTDMKVFWHFQTKLHKFTRQQVYDTSRKTDKSGLGYTRIPRINYPKSDFKKSLGDEIELFELRIDQTRRVHGFRMKSVFYLCWLDKGHRICVTGKYLL